MILFHEGGSKSVVHVQLYNSSEVVHVQVGRLLPFFVKLFDLWTIYFGREIVGTVSGIGILKVQFVLSTYGMTIPKLHNRHFKIHKIYFWNACSENMFF